MNDAADPRMVVQQTGLIVRTWHERPRMSRNGRPSYPLHRDPDGVPHSPRTCPACQDHRP